LKMESGPMLGKRCFSEMAQENPEDFMKNKQARKGDGDDSDSGEYYRVALKPYKAARRSSSF